MSEPKVSVVIPVYNTSKYLVRCLDSVMAQSLKEIEVIIVNDGSTDGSDIICQDFIKTNNLGWILASKPNGGLSSARQYGWELSTGECIVFVDSDDEIHKDYCRLMHEAIANTNSQLAICGYSLCSESTKTTYVPDIQSDIIENVFVEYGKRLIFDSSTGKRLPGFLWMRMMKRDLITRDCFISEHKVYAEDQIFDLEYCKSVKRIAVVHEALYNYYVNLGSLTLKYRPNILDMTVCLHDYYYDFLKSNNLLNSDATAEFERMKVEGAISAMVNVSRFGNIKDARLLVKRIKNDTKIQESFDHLRDSSVMTRNQKIWRFLIDNEIVVLPYVYYSFRRRLS